MDDRTPLAPGTSPLVIVLTGPSGVGKDALMRRMIELGYPVAIPATMTTRPPRVGEIEGFHHVFVDREEFQRQLDAGELLEHAEVYDNYYGVPRSQVRAALATGKHVMIRVDVQGAATLRDVIPDALFLFLAPERIEHLEHHLRSRGSEDGEAIRRRVAEARREIEVADASVVDHVVTNVEGDLDATVEQVRAIIEREATRPDRRPVEV